MSESKKSTFFGGAAILAASAIVVKLIGAVYKLPLANILTDAAYADFDSAYAIYNVFLTISTAGLPVALSKTISESNALGRYNQVQRIFRVAFTAFLTMGLISFFCMSVLAKPLSDGILNNPKALYCVVALSPSVLCVCIMSSFRGYFQGHFNMWPTGVSQIIEAFFKLVVGLALAYALLKMNVRNPEIPDLGERLPAVGAIIGVSIGSVVALVFMLFIYARHRRSRQRGSDRPDPSGDILSNLLRLAIPITLSQAATSLVTLIDGSLVMGQLTNIFHMVDGLALAADGTGPALDAARAMKGIYGKCMAIYNLPFSMMVPLTACIIPAVSAALARKDRREAKQVSESALRVGLLVAFPMGMGLFALGGPIMGLLVKGINVSIAGPLLSILGLASMFVALQLLCNSILQANNMVNLPILAVVVGGIVKIIVNYTLVGNPDIRINGAPVGTLCCFLIIDVLEIFIIRRAIPKPPSILRSALKPLIAAVIMGIGVKAVYGLLARLLAGMPRFYLEGSFSSLSWSGNAVATLGAILMGVLLYLILVLALRVLTREDLALMPKGDKIARILHIQ